MKLDKDTRSLIRVFVSIGISLMFFFGVSAYIDREYMESSLDWNHTNGFIIESYTFQSRKTNSRAVDHVEIKYNFTVKDKDYISNRIAASELDFDNTQQATQFLSNFQANQTVTVYYHPNNPEHSLLQRIISDSRTDLINFTEGVFGFFYTVILLITIPDITEWLKIRRKTTVLNKEEKNKILQNIKEKRTNQKIADKEGGLGLDVKIWVIMAFFGWIYFASETLYQTESMQKLFYLSNTGFIPDVLNREISRIILIIGLITVSFTKFQKLENPTIESVLSNIILTPIIGLWYMAAIGLAFYTALIVAIVFILISWYFLSSSLYYILDSLISLVFDISSISSYIRVLSLFFSAFLFTLFYKTRHSDLLIFEHINKESEEEASNDITDI